MVRGGVFYPAPARSHAAPPGFAPRLRFLFFFFPPPAAFILLDIVIQYRQAPFTHTRKHTTSSVLLPILLRCSASSSYIFRLKRVCLPLPLFTLAVVQW
jgi:hypothetical protein